MCPWPHALLRQFSPRWLLLARVTRASRVLASLLLVQDAGESSRRLPCSKASEAGKATGMLFVSRNSCRTQFSEAAPGQRIRTMSTLPLDTGWKPHVSVWKSVTCRFAIFISVTLLFGDPSVRTGGLLVHYSHFSKDSCTRQCKVLIDIKGHFSTKLLSLRCPQR